jgi:Kef-type K+ transport system membrane component KefB
MELLYVLLVLLTVTRLFGELAQRLGQPIILGELVAGIALGMVVHSHAETFPVLANLPHNEVFKGITDLSIFFLMLLAGLELHPRDMVKGSTASLLIALGGMFLPLGLGVALAWWFIPDSEVHLAQSIFLGTALAITAVPVSVKVLMDLEQVHSRVGHTIISAAVIDDMLSLALLAILTAVIEKGAMPDIDGFLRVFGDVAIFFIVATLIGRYLFPLIGRLLKSTVAADFEFSALLVGALAYSLLAEAMGLHFILGPFFTGLFFLRGTIAPGIFYNVKSKLSTCTTGLFAPVFFASIGMNLDITAATEVPLFVLTLTAIAFFGKLIGAGLPAYLFGYTRRESLAVGVGMSARGAVELIIAEIALRAGIFNHPEPVPAIVQHLFSSVVLMAVITTLLTPLLLRPILSVCTKDGCPVDR